MNYTYKKIMPLTLSLVVFCFIGKSYCAAAGEAPSPYTAGNRELNGKLIDAVERGNLKETLRLLDAGANIDTKGSQEDGPTALMWAAGRGNVEAVKMLLEKGANVNKKDLSGQTALILAIRTCDWYSDEAVNNTIQILKMLLKYGANKTIEDDLGQTAIDVMVIERRNLRGRASYNASQVRDTLNFYDPEVDEKPQCLPEGTRACNLM